MVGGFAVVLVTSVLLWTFGSAPQPDPSTPASESDVAAKIEFTNSVAAMHQKKAANSEKGTAKAEAVEPAAKKKPRLNKIVKNRLIRGPQPLACESVPIPTRFRPRHFSKQRSPNGSVKLASNGRINGCRKCEPAIIAAEREPIAMWTAKAS